MIDSGYVLAAFQDLLEAQWLMSLFRLLHARMLDLILEKPPRLIVWRLWTFNKFYGTESRFSRAPEPYQIWL